MEKNFLTSIQEVIGLLQEGKIEQAFLLIHDWPNFPVNDAGDQCHPLFLSLGVQLAKARYFSEAIVVLAKAQEFNPNHLATQYNLGLAYAYSGNHRKAIEQFDRALEISPDDIDTLANKAASLNDLELYKDALDISDQILKANQTLKAAWMIRAISLASMGKQKEALVSLDKILESNSSNSEAHMRRALVLDYLGQTQEAILSYERTLLFNPESVEALSNLAGLFRQERLFPKALSTCEKALRLNPRFANAWVNQAITLADMGLHQEAIGSYGKAIEIEDTLSNAWVGKGFSHSSLKQFELAANAFERALAIDSHIDFMLGPLAHAKMQICDWENYDELLKAIASGLRENKKVSPPFQIIGLVDDPKLIQTSARLWMKDQHPIVHSYSEVKEPCPPKSRIKLGYFSADFREHPVSQLIAGLIENHDRNRFEVYAFSLGPHIPDAMRERLEKAFDHFIDIHQLSDQEAALLARKEEINIAIDLTGLTGNSRPGIFANRAAPVQVNYLGYPGTMGAPFMDYIIADKVLIPETEQEPYDEKVIYMPNSFQVNDETKHISSKHMTRADFNLLEDTFVFCAFSNSFKITPTIFSTWMNLLKAIPKSVLWLSIENEIAQQNLQKQVILQGVSADRLIFAKRLPELADHLARYRLADLFLDTTPYGAHTTASDALWAGLPVLTCVGKGYVSRVAASLLTALNLQELIVTNLMQYEQKAIELASDPKSLKELKERLQDAIKSSPLFDTKRFSRDLEYLYVQIYK